MPGWDDFRRIILKRGQRTGCRRAGVARFLETLDRKRRGKMSEVYVLGLPNCAVGSKLWFRGRCISTPKLCAPILRDRGTLPSFAGVSRRHEPGQIFGGTEPSRADAGCGNPRASKLHRTAYDRCGKKPSATQSNDGQIDLERTLKPVRLTESRTAMEGREVYSKSRQTSTAHASPTEPIPTQSLLSYPHGSERGLKSCR